MKPGTLTSKRLLLPVLAVTLTLALVSWDFDQTPPGGNYQQERNPTDTPKVNKNKPEKKVQDLDDVLDELNAVDIQKELMKAQQEMSKALKEFDGAKMKLEIEKAMKEVDMEKIMKELDMEKIMKEVNESISKIKLEELKLEMEQFSKTEMKEIQEEMAKAHLEMEKMKPELEKEMARVKIEMEKMKPELEQEMAKVKLEMEKMKPELEKEMARVKIEMEKAKVEVEKAKEEVKEYKIFVDGLDKDGLINKKESYTIKHKDGELIINGKKVSTQVYSKYRAFLQKHPKFSIEKSDDDFDIDMD